jgi:hypothetical protein
MSPEFIEKWEHILADVEKNKIPIEFIKKMVLKLEGKKQHTINVERLIFQGLDPEQIEDIIGMINDMGIQVHEVAPDEDTLLEDAVASGDDEDAAEVAALASVDSEFGRTTDPVPDCKGLKVAVGCNQRRRALDSVGQCCDLAYSINLSRRVLDGAASRKCGEGRLREC